MIRSLRLRFFLITWPLIVLAVAAVAFTFERWSEVRLTELELTGPARATEPPEVDSLARLWARGELSAGALASGLSALDRRDSVTVVVVDRDGAVVAASDPGVRPAEDDRGDRGQTPNSGDRGQTPNSADRGLTPISPNSGGGGPRAFVRESDEGGRRSREVVEVTGRPLADSAGVARAEVYLLPRHAGRETTARVGELRADVRRTVWVSVIVASAVAAVLSLLLAGPLVAQVTRLAAAAARVRAGDLGARVRAGSSDELGRTEAAFNEMAAALEHAEAHKRNLVHDVAHELRTPLTNVVGMLEAIEDGLRRPDAVTIAALRAEARLLTALVNDLQELSLAESGQLTFELAAVDVAAEAAAAVDGMRDAADGVALEGLATAPAFATADPVRLRQVLRNLLRNALTNTPAGGRVRLSVERRPGEVGLRVADTGRGIPAAHIPLVWERFHRVDPSRDRAAGGRGLGLAIVRQFVERMGGRVALTSVENEGTTIEVWLREATPPEARQDA